MAYDMEDLHPDIADRRRQNRSLVAVVEIYNNGDVEYHIPPSFNIYQNLRFIVTKLEHAKRSITERLKPR